MEMELNTVKKLQSVTFSQLTLSEKMLIKNLGRHYNFFYEKP